jgi:hypothetical protein
MVSVSARWTRLSRFLVAASTPNQAVRKSWRAERISLTRISQLLPSGLGSWPSVVRFMQASKVLAVGSHSWVCLIILSAWFRVGQPQLYKEDDRSATTDDPLSAHHRRSSVIRRQQV